MLQHFQRTKSAKMPTHSPPTPADGIFINFILNNQQNKFYQPARHIERQKTFIEIQSEKIKGCFRHLKKTKQPRKKGLFMLDI